MRKSKKYGMVSFMVVFLLLKVTFAQMELPQDLEKFYINFMEELLKLNLDEVYDNLVSEGFKKTTDKEKFKNFVQELLGNLGEPRSMELLGYEVYPTYFKLVSKVSYSQTDVQVVSIIQKTPEGYKVRNLNLSSPYFRKMLLSKSQEEQAYLKEVMEKIKRGEFRKIYDKDVAPKVKKEVDFEIVKAILQKISQLPLEKAELHNYYTREGGKYHVFEYRIEDSQGKWMLQFVIQKEGQFYLVDANVYTIP